MERLSETTPSAPKSIINQFNAEFKDVEDIAMPSETNGLEKVKVYSPEDEIKSMHITPENTEKELKIKIKEILETSV